MEYKDLQKLTVKKLKELAADKTEISGVSGMKKGELIDALCQELNIEKPHKEKVVAHARTKDEIKADIKKFKDQRIKALETKDSILLKKSRFHIKRLKRELRKVV